MYKKYMDNKSKYVYITHLYIYITFYLFNIFSIV